MLYPTTTTIPFEAKNYDYRMATINRKHEYSTTRYDLKDKASTRIYMLPITHNYYSGKKEKRLLKGDLVTSRLITD